jgi:DnaJ-class molecular chaperone
MIPPQVKRCKACDGTGYFMTEEELSAPETILFPVGGPADECKVCDGTGYVDVASAHPRPNH